MTLAKALAAAAGNAGEATYVDDVFSTWLYTANNQIPQTITNGIDLATEGGLVWIKTRNAAYEHFLADTVRGADKYLQSQSTAAQITNATELTSFNTNGFSVGTDSSGIVNFGSTTLASWTFRKAPKFFDVVTYTGDGTANRSVSHSLGSTPGCIIVKQTNSVRSWPVFHRSLANGGTTENLFLEQTTAASGNPYFPAVSSTTFQVSASSAVNASGGTYVAYLFAHDAGGFGADGSENVISCGSYTGNGGTTTPNQINIGFEPQWLLIKASSTTSNWAMGDLMRGMYTESGGTAKYRELLANTSGAEGGSDGPAPTATGFAVSGTGLPNASGVTYIYIAIRRPMKPPESGTQVFAPVQYTTSPEGFITGFPVDLGIAGNKSGTDKWYWQSRLQGAVLLNSASTAAEVGSGSAKFDMMNGYGTGFSTAYWTDAFKRASGFMDVVCYTGTGVARTVAHNLTVAPELMIVKARSFGGYPWYVYSAASASANDILFLNNTNEWGTGYTSIFNSTRPTDSVFTVGSGLGVNQSSSTYVAYLFATLAGISKVGSYTGTGTTLQINCGFTSGARFALIKRTDSTGDWYVWDSARGIVAGNDPYLLLNSTAAEVTNTDYVDTYSAGFEISSTAPAAINANGGSFIFFAVA